MGTVARHSAPDSAQVESMRLLPYLLLLCVTIACAGPSTSSAAPLEGPARVTFRDYRSAQHLALVDAGHTDRVALYSDKRNDAALKVASDDIMSALVEFIESSDFAQYARPGAAPGGGNEWAQSIEVSAGGTTRHILARKNIQAGHAATFREVRDAFLATYNNIFQLQAIDAEPGDQVFKRPESSSKKGKN